MNDARAQGTHAGLTREQVLRTALELVDREGAGALSMRRLARELGVEAMTLYHHVQNKQALEDAIVEHVLDESLTLDDGSTAWQDVISGYALDLHRGLVAHPGAATLFATRPAVTVRTLAALDRLLGVLADAGFAPDTGLRIVHATAASVIGQHLARPSDPGPGPALAADALPHVRAALAAGSPTVEARVSLVVDALVVGFERLLAEAGTVGGTSAVGGS